MLTRCEQVLVAAVLGLLAACDNVRPPAGAGPEPARPVLPLPGAPAPYALHAAADAAGLDGQPRPIRLAPIRSIVARLTVPSLPAGVVWLETRFVSPKGTAYDVQRVPYAAERRAQRVMAGDTPLRVREVRPFPGGFALEFSVPVAGTEIQLRPQYGTWRLVAQLDGHPPVEIPVELVEGM